MPRMTPHRPFWRVADKPADRARLRRSRRARRASVKGRYVTPTGQQIGGLNAGRGLVGYPFTYRPSAVQARQLFAAHRRAREAKT